MLTALSSPPVMAQPGSGFEILGDRYSSFYEVMDVYSAEHSRSKFHPSVQYYFRKADHTVEEQRVLTTGMDRFLTNALGNQKFRDCAKDAYARLPVRPVFEPVGYLSSLVTAESPNTVYFFFRSNASPDMPREKHFQVLPRQGYHATHFPHFGVQVNRHAIAASGWDIDFWSLQLGAAALNALGLSDSSGQSASFPSILESPLARVLYCFVRSQHGVPAGFESSQPLNPDRVFQ